MISLRSAAIAAASLALVASSLLLGACAQDPYQNTMYTLQRNLRHRNEKWDNFQQRQAMRRDARDDRYQAWFNNVMQ